MTMQNNVSRTRRSLLKAAALTAAAPAFMMRAAQASTYPAGTVSLMVPYPAGGPSDTAARILAGPIGDALGTHVVVENVGGRHRHHRRSTRTERQSGRRHFFPGHTE